MTDWMTPGKRSVSIRWVLGWAASAATLVLVVFGVVFSARAQSNRSVNDGVYTTDQAARGEKIFMGVGRCYICHLRNMQGDPQRQAARLVAPMFIADWGGKTVDDLFYKIQYTMPADLGGAATLPSDQVSDLISFILQRNGYPAGAKELPTDRGQLKLIAVEKPPAK